MISASFIFSIELLFDLPRALEGAQGPGDLGSAPTEAERRSEPGFGSSASLQNEKRDAFTASPFHFSTCVRGFESLRNPQTIDFTALLHPPFKMEQEMEQMHFSFMISPIKG